MQKRKLGNSGLEVSALGLAVWDLVLAMVLQRRNRKLSN